MKASKVESMEEARNEYKKLLEEGWGKTYRFNNFFKNGDQVTYLKFDIIKKLLLNKLQNGRLNIKKTFIQILNIQMLWKVFMNV